MHLYEIPIICVLIGLALYVVLGGADFGAGLWQLESFLVPHRDEEARRRAEENREHAHHSMGPVWEANHVWLIFVLTVTWTAYPKAFGAIASTLEVPLLIAGIGIVFRGAAYALRAGSASARESALIDTVFSLSSVLTPFALGTVIGAIVLQRVPVGNAAGSLIGSWTGLFSILLGALVVVLCAYLAAVYLAADAHRVGEEALAARFRARALGIAVIAGALAIALLPVLHADAHHFYTRLIDGPGLVGVIISVIGGVGTIALVLTRRFGAARTSAAVAVAGLIIGFALAQNPIFLPGLTIAHAAAPTQTIVPLLFAILAGIVILFPSLGFLFALHLGGHFDLGEEDRAGGGAGRASGAGPGVGAMLASSRQGLAARGAIAGLLGGLGFLTAADAPWAHIVGVISLGVCALCAIAAVGPAELAAGEPHEHR
jgi:cytochrome d ubiquinol oxidase subunit II